MLLLSFYEQAHSCASVSRFWYKAAVKADAQRRALKIESAKLFVLGLDALICGDRFPALLQFIVQKILRLEQARKLAACRAHLRYLQILQLFFSNSQSYCFGEIVAALSSSLKQIRLRRIASFLIFVFSVLC